jgi:hypothetical protein
MLEAWLASSPEASYMDAWLARWVEAWLESCNAKYYAMLVECIGPSGMCTMTTDNRVKMNLGHFGELEKKAQVVRRSRWINAVFIRQSRLAIQNSVYARAFGRICVQKSVLNYDLDG